MHIGCMLTKIKMKFTEEKLKKAFTELLGIKVNVKFFALKT